MWTPANRLSIDWINCSFKTDSSRHQIKVAVAMLQAACPDTTKICSRVMHSVNSRSASRHLLPQITQIEYLS
jgi:hypothetical protein